MYICTVHRCLLSVVDDLHMHQPYTLMPLLLDTLDSYRSFLPIYVDTALSSHVFMFIYAVTVHLFARPVNCRLSTVPFHVGNVGSIRKSIHHEICSEAISLVRLVFFVSIYWPNSITWRNQNSHHYEKWKALTEETSSCSILSLCIHVTSTYSHSSHASDWGKNVSEKGRCKIFYETMLSN